MQYKKRNGDVIEWTGASRCICTTCEEKFNSVAAFDAHLKLDNETGMRYHDHSWMERNKDGYLVTALMPESALTRRQEGASNVSSGPRH